MTFIRSYKDNRRNNSTIICSRLQNTKSIFIQFILPIRSVAVQFVSTWYIHPTVAKRCHNFTFGQTNIQPFRLWQRVVNVWNFELSPWLFRTPDTPRNIESAPKLRAADRLAQSILHLVFAMLLRGRLVRTGVYVMFFERQMRRPAFHASYCVRTHTADTDV